ncbi:hypothetical protein [Streptacidiphilus sp. MAP5-3]|uniref:hypothetical protein n=1 Tax=unclassified Streptacidiphilus TaxID=2643834 RepID=UPI003517F927
MVMFMVFSERIAMGWGEVVQGVTRTLGLAVCHRFVAVADAVQVDGVVEDPAGFDAAFQDVGEDVVDVVAGRIHAAGEGDVAHGPR